MKQIPVLYIFLTLVLWACNGAEPQTGSSEEATASKPEHGKTPGTYQYCFVTADDTAILNLRISDGGVSGSLLLQYFGGVRSDGKLENAYFRYDTLMAEYQYWSDSGPGRREVMFLIRNDVAIEATGPVITKGDKQVFKSHKTVSFSGPELSIDGCGLKMPTFQKQ